MPSQAKAQKATAGTAYQMIPVIGPSEGIDLRLSPTLLPPGRARTLTNWSLEEPGALVMRPGWIQFSTAALGTPRLQGGARVYLNTAVPVAASTIFTLVAYQQGLYLQADNGAWPSTTAYLSGLSTGEIYFPSDRDLVAALDGSSRLFKSTNGSSWTQFGLTRPGAGPTLSTLSTGGMSSGEYEFNYTFKARGLAVESNGSSAASTVYLTATSGAINVVLPNSTNPDVNAIVVYGRKKSDGETVRRKISSLAQSAGVNSTLIVTSTAWTTNDEEPTDHDVPASLSFGVVWKSRWWARDSQVTNRLRFTQIFQPQSWPALFFIDLPFERGDAIQAMVPLGDALLVFGNTKIFLIIGQTSLDFEVRPTLASQDGALGPRAVCVIENGVVHAGAAGVWMFDGVTDRLLSFDIEPAWQDLVSNAAADALSRTACVYHLKRKELRVAVARRYPSGMPGEWILDMNRSRDGNTAWTATDRDISGYIPWDGPESVAGNRGRLLSWPSTNALLHEEAASGYSANSSNQTAEYEGPGLTLGAFRARWPDIRGEYEPHGGTFSIEPLIDGVSQGAQTVNIGAGQAVYGTGTYGTSIYAGAGRRQFFKMLPLSADGRSAVVKMTYVGMEKFRLFNYHMGVVPEPKSREFSE